MTDNERIKKLKDAEAQLKSTTINYSAWKKKVASGAYSPKDGSATAWGKHFTLINEVIVDLTSSSSMLKGAQFHAMWDAYQGFNLQDNTLNKFALAGIKAVRIDVGWDQFEWTSKGQRPPNVVIQLDHAVNGALVRGMEVLLTVWQTPPWAGPIKLGPPNNPQDYGDFVHWLAQTFVSRVKAYEIWNEPNPNQSNWSGNDASKYVALCKAAYTGIKSADPNAKVVLGGPDSNDYPWIESLYQRGLKGNVDVVATHPYQGEMDRPPDYCPTGDKWWFENVTKVKDVMTSYGDSSPIWFTEYGWSAGPLPDSSTPNWLRQVSEATQAAYATQAIQLMRTWPYVEAAFWYQDRAITGDQFQDGYGLIRDDGTVRPALAAIGAA